MSPNRRDALHLLGSVGLAGLAGCLGRTGGGSETTTTTTSTTPTPEPTSTTTDSTSTTTTQPTDETKTENVRIENRTDSSEIVSIEVLDDTEDVLISGTYEVPAMTGLQFPREFEWGTYTVRGKVEGGDWHEAAWEPSSCASTPAPNGDMDAGVVVTEEAVEILHNTCDFLKLGSHFVDANEPAAEYAVTAE